MVLTAECAAAGVKAIRKEASQLIKKLRGDMKTEEAARLSGAVDEVCERVNELYDMSGAENFLHYFYKKKLFVFGLF